MRLREKREGKDEEGREREKKLISPMCICICAILFIRIYFFILFRF
jgi:hypothetical protein